MCNKSSRLRRIVYGLALLAIFLAVGTMDYVDAVAEERLYCEMVQAGHWPDYREIVDTVCLTPR